MDDNSKTTTRYCKRSIHPLEGHLMQKSFITLPRNADNYSYRYLSLNERFAVIERGYHLVPVLPERKIQPQKQVRLMIINYSGPTCKPAEGNCDQPSQIDAGQSGLSGCQDDYEEKPAFAASDCSAVAKRGEMTCAKRRKRCSFSAEQVYRLEIEFQKQRYLSADMRSRLALMLGLSQQQVKIWFQNRRYKSKPKENAKMNMTQCGNMTSRKENIGNLTRPVVVLVRDGCPTFEYFISAFKNNNRPINCA